jgi:phage terminase small subunit
LKLTGVYEPGRHGGRAVTMPEVTPLGAAPDWLSSEAKEVWRALVREAPRGVLSKLDTPYAIAYCDLVVDLQQVIRLLAEAEKLGVDTAALRKRRRHVLADLVALGRTLTLTPNARNRITEGEVFAATEFGPFQVIKGGRT